MNSKISNKPDHGLNSPLKPTSFPVDLSLFQVSQTSSKNKKSAPPTEMTSIQFSSAKASEAQPNLFQYNERTPLLFSSDEEDNHEPSFNYFPLGEHGPTLGESISPFVLNSHEKNEVKTPSKYNPPYHNPTYMEDNRELTIGELLSEQKPIKINGDVENSNKKSEQIIIQKVYVVGKQQKPSPAKIQSKVNENIINGPNDPILDGKLAPSASEPSKKQQPSSSKHQEDSLALSKSEKSMPVEKMPHQIQRESSKKENSSVFSKTDEIIDRVKLHKNQDILIQEQSDQSSDKNYKQTQIKPVKQSQIHPYVTVRDSMQSYQGNPQRKRRNRIFDNSSIKNKSKQGNVTPEKGVQTDRIMNDSATRQEIVREYDYYPQIKALNVLNKLVDQINPNITKISRRNLEVQQSFLDLIVSCTEQLESTTRAFNNITIIEKVEEANLIRARKQTKQRIREAKGKISKVMSIRIDEQLTEREQRIFRNFQQLTRTFQIMDGVIQSYTDTKYRLNHLLQSTKGLMINFKRGELKKIYCTLRQMAIEIETLKSIRAGCGELRLQRMFKEYLEGQIRPLTELEEDMREKVENMGPTFKM